MSQFVAGDRVQVNGSLIATIQSIDPEGDRIVYVITPAGGGSDTVYAHISQTRLEHLVAPAVVADEKPEDGTVSEGGTSEEDVTE